MNTQIENLCTALVANNTKEKYEATKSQIATALNHLIENDFNAFVAILYRLDISENQIINMGQNDELNPENIATIIIEREIQKAKSRKENTKPYDASTGEEAW